MTETRRAKVRYDGDDYAAMNQKLQQLAHEVEDRVGCAGGLCLRWNITETVLHDEDAECVPDDYPVLIVEVQKIFRDKLWVMKRCPYILFVNNRMMYLRDNLDNLVSVENIAETIAKTLCG